VTEISEDLRCAGFGLPTSGRELGGDGGRLIGPRRRLADLPTAPAGMVRKGSDGQEGVMLYLLP
jgi:hypothetical protein